jgi:high-affinity nickel-transport protein
MLTLLSLLSIGLFLGMRHATDADHVVAVSTFVSRERDIRGAVMRGILWGLGHTVTVVLFGGAIIFFGLVIPDRLGLGMEFSVGLMLILLGIMNVASFKEWCSEIGSAAGAPDDRGFFGHSHSPDHTEATPHAGSPFRPTSRVVRPLFVGVVHGLAGSAAVALLILPLIKQPIWGVLYLIIFGVGTIAGMMLITAAIAVPFAYSARRFAWFNRSLGLAAGFLSLGFGIVIVYHTGFVKGLLTG